MDRERFSRHGLAALFLLIPLLLASPGCAMREIQTLRTDIKDLQNRIYEMQKRKAESQVEIQELRDNCGGGSTGAPLSSGSPAQHSSEESQVEPAVPGSTFDSGFSGPSRHDEPPSGESLPGMPAGSSPPSSSSGPATGGPGGGRTDELYTAGYSQFNTGNFQAAQQSFQSFLAHSPESDLADDAQYWIGECFFSLKDYRRAILEFRKVIDQYPFGNRVPHSFLKIGLSYLALGERDRAAENLETVVEAFPKSDVATVARATLDELQKH